MATTGVGRLHLSAGSNPADRYNHAIKVVARNPTGAGTIRAALYEGANNRSGDLETAQLTNALAEYTLAISQANAANIVDYSNLELRFWGYSASTGVSFEIEKIWLEIPHAAPLELVDAGTVSFKFTPSGTELYRQSVTIDSATVYFNLDPEDIAPPFAPPQEPPLPQLILPGPPPPLKYWTVVHYRHDGTAIGEEFPSSPEFALYLGKTGYLTYELDKSSSLAIKTNCEPYATDYALFFGEHKIQAGIHTDIEASDLEAHTFKISGKDWYHWFEGQLWPFDPNDPLANVYSAYQTDAFTVVEDWLTVIQAESDTIQFTFDNGTCGVLVNAKIEVADSENMLAKITALSQTYPGFDFEITPEKEFKLYYPNKSRDIELTLEQGSNIYQLTYLNKGPTGTRIVASAQGLSSKMGVVLDHADISRFRRWMTSEDFGNLPDATTLNNRASSEVTRNASPHLEFTCKIIPDFVEDFLSVVAIGDNIPVYGDIGWDIVDDRFRLVSIVAAANDEGDTEYELGFDDGTLSL